MIARSKGVSGRAIPNAAYGVFGALTSSILDNPQFSARSSAV